MCKKHEPDKSMGILCRGFVGAVGEEEDMNYYYCKILYWWNNIRCNNIKHHNTLVDYHLYIYTTSLQYRIIMCVIYWFTVLKGSDRHTPTYS